MTAKAVGKLGAVLPLHHKDHVRPLKEFWRNRNGSRAIQTRGGDLKAWTA